MCTNVVARVTVTQSCYNDTTVTPFRVTVCLLILCAGGVTVSAGVAVSEDVCSGNVRSLEAHPRLNLQYVAGPKFVRTGVDWRYCSADTPHP